MFASKGHRVLIGVTSGRVKPSLQRLPVILPPALPASGARSSASSTAPPRARVRRPRPRSGGGLSVMASANLDLVRSTSTRRYFVWSAMRLCLSMTCALAVCAALGACGDTHAQSTSSVSVRRVTLPAQPPAVVTQVPPGPCHAPKNVTAANGELVPGTPCVIVLSRYRGLPARPGTQLVARVELRRASLLRRLTSEFDALRPMPPGNYACPDDNGSEIKAILKYPHQQSLQMDIALSGCRDVARGPVGRWATQPPGEQLLTQLERLVGRR